MSTSEKNKKQDTKRARIIGNFGDPGLSEDKHFDLLSQFLIVQIQGKNGGVDCIIEDNNVADMVFVVYRPKELWIDYVAGSTTADYIRRSFEGQVNSGRASININAINPPYLVGDQITIEKLPMGPTPEKPTNSLFYKDITPLHFSTINSLPYSPIYENNSGKLKGFKASLIMTGTPQKIHVRVYADEWWKIIQEMEQALFKKANLNPNFMDLKKSGRIWNADTSFIDLPVISWLDTNSTKRGRNASDSCLPLVVTSPDSFPQAAVRQLGTISYNPSYNFVCINAAGFTGCNQQCPTGATGATGDSGTQGSIGDTGPTGDAGTNGTSGVNGASGINGVSGSSGVNGMVGASGTDGTDGISGVNGTSGIDGTAGSSGSDGTAGTSGTSGTS